MLRTLTIYSVICQLHPNKTGREKMNLPKDKYEIKNIYLFKLFNYNTGKRKKRKKRFLLMRFLGI